MYTTVVNILSLPPHTLNTISSHPIPFYSNDPFSCYLLLIVVFYDGLDGKECDIVFCLCTELCLVYVSRYEWSFECVCRSSLFAWVLGNALCTLCLALRLCLLLNRAVPCEAVRWQARGLGTRCVLRTHPRRTRRAHKNAAE